MHFVAGWYIIESNRTKCVYREKYPERDHTREWARDAASALVGTPGKCTRQHAGGKEGEYPCAVGSRYLPKGI